MNLIPHLIPLFEDFGQSSFNSIWQGLGLLLLFLDANIHFLDISIKKSSKRLNAEIQYHVIRHSLNGHFVQKSTGDLI
jgi:hypothetical protein